jgi:hypothetical protein
VMRVQEMQEGGRVGSFHRRPLKFGCALGKKQTNRARSFSRRSAMT